MDAEIVNDRVALAEEHVLQVDERVDEIEEAAEEQAVQGDRILECVQRVEHLLEVLTPCVERIEAMTQQTLSAAEASEEASEEAAASATLAAVVALETAQETPEETLEGPPVEAVAVPESPEPTQEPPKPSFWERCLGGT